jgi:hypothetical protein
VSLADVEQFHIPESGAADTERQLRAAGAEGFETWVLWTGRQHGRRFEVQTVHVPEQTAYRLDSGLCVKVDGSALHQLNVWLHEHDETLGAQVHAHPDRAYHSDTDNAFSIITALGGLSLVVPRFCHYGLLGRGSAAYRLTADGWERSPIPAWSLIKVR